MENNEGYGLMNSLLNVEGNSFSALFQEYEPQLYDIRSHILHFYDNIKDRDLSIIAESNLEELYEIFSELDDLGHLDVDSTICECVLQDPVIRALLPAVHSNYSNYFSLHETQLARKILENGNPWEVLESFPLYPRYKNLINTHFQNSSRIRVLAFIGCGPLPVTLLLLSKLYGIHCIGIDKDPEAVALAKSCVKHFGLEKEINIIEGDETVLSKLEWGSVLIAALAEPKSRIFQNLHTIIKKKKSKNGKPISVCYRSYTGMRQLFYWPVLPEHTRGFRKINEIHPSCRVNNSLVFLECE
ncbi:MULTISPECIES: nicotianamine synthase family protein [unclassified Methanosarcina]|uniref:nicotianamine synthase family protein n=1 Tax=unclassified Methanosarcina TaxID=2644672 RepID=UPI0006158CC7|nr:MULTISPECIES: nicotianamine synthase family protein [unclassified Methanosarcina]AKB17243.1 hypothetical protein MSWHS_0380 [Methanosarcina sp. WWM596]AKB20640.1 hypothetical protein MSWH1_0369 [Methanosarcina sp. WH1]